MNCHRGCYVGDNCSFSFFLLTLLDSSTNVEKTPENIWRNKSRLNTIVTAITAGKTKKMWLSILGGKHIRRMQVCCVLLVFCRLTVCSFEPFRLVAGFVFLAIFLGAVGSNTDPNAEGLTYLPKSYYYPPQSDDMRYATCSLTNIRGGFGEGTLMFDYIAMATLAYTSEDLTQEGLDEWFGEGVAVDRTDIVDEFRAVYDTSNAAVFFKLFEFPSIGLGVISIRGTSNNWDMLADSQLWSAAALMQGIRFVLPAGEIWTPILDREFLFCFCFVSLLASPAPYPSTLFGSQSPRTCLLDKSTAGTGFGKGILLYSYYRICQLHEEPYRLH